LRSILNILWCVQS